MEKNVMPLSKEQCHKIAWVMHPGHQRCPTKHSWCRNPVLCKASAAILSTNVHWTAPQGLRWGWEWRGRCPFFQGWLLRSWRKTHEEAITAWATCQRWKSETWQRKLMVCNRVQIRTGIIVSTGCGGEAGSMWHLNFCLPNEPPDEPGPQQWDLASQVLDVHSEARTDSGRRCWCQNSWAGDTRSRCNCTP